MRPTLILLAVIAAVLPAYGKKGAPLELAGVACQTPAPEHCPAANCPSALVIDQGNAVEPKTNRKFFLDYPCDLRKGEKVTFIMSLHGFGSYGNWQRHYFPMMDFKDKYHLVIATPNSPVQYWSATDDEYLQNIVSMIYDQIGKENIKAFWLVGHSQGGMTSNRLMRTDFFSERVDGWLSLSGGRLGENPGRGDFSNIAARGRAAAATATKDGGRGNAPNPLAGGAALRELPSAEFSFIYETGRNEMDAKGLPETSKWAEKLGCSARVRKADIVDTTPGYVYDTRSQNPSSPGWGTLPRPGTADVFEYPRCKDGRIVADVVRLDKGHTEGLEPHVTEALIKLMLSAKPNSHASTN
ncbi:MAG TPA: alpha/beta hydrolase [Bryobacteraceae bacterium]|nr:alpha/beta hydrolase [Bryobacteraceae bacterium]